MVVLPIVAATAVTVTTVVSGSMDVNIVVSSTSVIISISVSVYMLPVCFIKTDSCTLHDTAHCSAYKRHSHIQ